MILYMKRKDGGVSFADISKHKTEKDVAKAIFLATHYAEVNNDTDKTVKRDSSGNLIYSQYEWLDSYWLGEKEDMPSDRYFRDQWTASGKVISVDMEKAKEHHMGNIRAARDKKLKELDVETLKGNDVQVEKQKLRDIPQTFDLSASTPDELKAMWPEELK
jgi:hypothetical protein